MRASGILLHISSLPSPYGIGTMGKCAYNFIDFLKAAGQHYWQMLPLNMTGYGDSPYQSFSVYAGNPYFIDLDLLAAQGFLQAGELRALTRDTCATKVDYGKISERYIVLRSAYRHFDSNQMDFKRFCADNAHWLNDFALYMCIKTHYRQEPWFSWAQGLQDRNKQELEPFSSQHDEIGFHKFLQYEFFKQFRALKTYANENGVQLIGDIPIYVAEDSADVWVYPDLFVLDGDNRPAETAGCPPDFFSKDGQAWGNPLYNWDRMAEDGYAWWISRVKFMMEMYDIVRIDHFRGFAGYFAIPRGKMPVAGVWKKGPDIALFEAVKRSAPHLRIIAEDLGFLDDDVRALLKKTGFPGMEVLQFAFDSRETNNYLPHFYDKNCVVYTGTHDNDTVAGWHQSSPRENVAHAAEYFGIPSADAFPWSFIRGAWASVADLAIAPMQDFLCLGSEGRMNIPSTVGGNWAWRMDSHALTGALAQRIRHITRLYERL